MRKSNTWLWLTLIVALVCVVWIKGIYGTTKSVITSQTAPLSEDNLFPAPHHTSYHMELRLDPIKLELHGRSVITSRNTTDAELTELWLTTYPNVMKDRATTPAPMSAYYSGFDPGWLTISSVTVNGATAAGEDLGISYRIHLPEPIKVGEEVTLKLEWKARIPQAAYRYGSKDGVILMGNFYPVLNVKDDRGWHTSINTKFGDPFYTQCADYTVRLWVPEAYQIAASGDILSIEAEDTGWQTMLIKAERVRDFALAAAYNYKMYHVKADGIEIVGFFNGRFPEVEKAVLEQAVAVVKFYNRTFGSYARPQLFLVQGPMEGFQGMEYSGLIFFTDEVFNPRFNEQRRAYLVAHEIAHQWWYDMVGNNQLQEPWLDEGLASWSARKYLEKVEYRSVQGRSGKTLVDLEKALTEIHSKDTYLDTAYQGGESFWLQLEEELGEGQVLKILRSYLATYKFKTATTEDLCRIISQHSRTSMESFFEKWFKPIR